ncbi:unnamed protein product [Schistosoma curassoni]|uniref:Terpenoid synthase n=1 Tax=Schistosoma curassoni TaxID=6186 RepID=A0A183KVU0_9TREM|nr:unnamed protein product [Schistosoma curassoni]
MASLSLLGGWTLSGTVAELEPNLKPSCFDRFCKALQIVEVTHQSFYDGLTFKCSAASNKRPLPTAPGDTRSTEWDKNIQQWMQNEVALNLTRLLKNIDDIEDGSHLRRGKPAAHCIFGVAPSINSANYAYFLALEKLSLLERPESVKIFTGA